MIHNVTQEQENLLKSGHVIQFKNDNNELEEWIYFPLWMKKVGIGQYEEVIFDKLPSKLIDIIKKSREEIHEKR